MTAVLSAHLHFTAALRLVSTCIMFLNLLHKAAQLEYTAQLGTAEAQLTHTASCCSAPAVAVQTYKRMHARTHTHARTPFVIGLSWSYTES